MLPALGTAGPSRLPVFSFCLPACSEPGRCEEIQTALLADDESTPEGSTAAAVLSIVGERHDVDLVWNAGITNASGSTRLSIAVERTADPARYVVTEQTGGTKADLDCGPVLEVPVRFEWTTADGALAENFEGNLIDDLRSGGVSVSTSSVSFQIDVDTGDLSGSLVPLSDEVDEFSFAAVLGYEERGYVHAISYTRDSGSATERTELVGSWGATEE